MVAGSRAGAAAPARAEQLCFSCFTTPQTSNAPLDGALHAVDALLLLFHALRSSSFVTTTGTILAALLDALACDTKLLL